MITNQGKGVVTNFFGRQTATLGGALAVGVSSDAPALDDETLGFEVVRVPVSSTSADLDNHRIIFKAVIPPGLVSNIYEIGLYHDGTIARARNITLTSPTAGTWTNATVVNSNYRIGTSSVNIEANANSTTTAEYVALGTDISAIAETLVLGFTADAYTTNLKVRLGNDASNYQEFFITGYQPGYNVIRVAWASGVGTGTVDLGKIGYVAVVISSGAQGVTNLYFDGIRIEASNPNDELVARTVLNTPVTVNTSVPTEIEYSLSVNV